MLYDELTSICSWPTPFQYSTTCDLWTDDHTSKMMLAYHLDEQIDAASRNKAFIDRSADWIVRRFGIGPGARIADFGCGPGLYTIRFARSGATVTGIDFSARSIDYARKAAVAENLPIEYVYTDYLTYDTEARFDLITMIMCDFCALGPGNRRTLLGIFHKLLAPGGSVLLDAYSLSAFAERTESSVCEKNLLDGFWSPEPYYGFLNIHKYGDEKVVLDKYTIVERTRTRTVYNWLQYFSPDSLEREFSKNGFTVTEMFADVTGTPFNPTASEFAVTATRR